MQARQYCTGPKLDENQEASFSCSLLPIPPGFMNSWTAFVLDASSEFDSNGWSDFKYRTAVSSRVGTGSLGRESSNRSMGLFEVSSIYPATMSRRSKWWGREVTYLPAKQNYCSACLLAPLLLRCSARNRQLQVNFLFKH